MEGVIIFLSNIAAASSVDLLQGFEFVACGGSFDLDLFDLLDLGFRSRWISCTSSHHLPTSASHTQFLGARPGGFGNSFTCSPCSTTTAISPTFPFPFPFGSLPLPRRGVCRSKLEPGGLPLPLPMPLPLPLPLAGGGDGGDEEDGTD